MDKTIEAMSAELPLYLIVLNDQDQYSIWPAQRAVPAGWRALGEPARREYCLDRIEELWTDMRPKSLKQAMGDAGLDNSAGNVSGGGRI
jgi:MbtH protein